MISMLLPAASEPSPVMLIFHFPARSITGAAFWTAVSVDAGALLSSSVWFSAARASSVPAVALIPVEDSIAASKRGSARKSVLSLITHFPHPAQAGLASMIRIRARLRIDFILIVFLLRPQPGWRWHFRCL